MMQDTEQRARRRSGKLLSMQCYEPHLDVLLALAGLCESVEGDNNRIRLVLYSTAEDGEVPLDIVLDPAEIHWQLAEVLEQSARWRALVKTGQAIVHPESR